MAGQDDLTSGRDVPPGASPDARGDAASPGVADSAEVAAELVSEVEDGPPADAEEVEVQRVPLATYNVLVPLPDGTTARALVTDLEQGGVLADSLSYLAVDSRSIGVPDDETSRFESEVSAVGDIGRKTAEGAGIGGGIGAAAGVGLFLVPGVGAVAGVGMLADGLLGAIGGSYVGGLAGLYRNLGMSEAWSDTFVDVEEGAVVVGVHTDDPEEARVASDVVPAAEARWFDRSGEPVPPPSASELDAG